MQQIQGALKEEEINSAEVRRYCFREAPEGFTHLGEIL